MGASFRRCWLVAMLACLCLGWSASARAQQLSPEKREKLRKQVEEQLKNRPKGQTLAPDQLKQLRDDLAKQLDQQLKRQAPRPSEGPSKLYQKNSPLVLGAFRPIVAAASAATVRILRDGKDASLGTVVGDSGWILTKASELSGTLTCRLRDGRELPARIIGIHEDTDLAMIKIDAKGLRPIEWRTAGLPEVGDWVAAPGLSPEPTAVGVLSVGPRQVAAPRALLGVILEQVDQGPKVIQVMPDSAALKAGIKVGDVIVGVDSKPTKTREELIGRVGSRKPGETLAFSILRAGKELSIAATLLKATQAPRAVFQNALGGALSERRSNFPQVLQHDTVLRPADCGGPLVDLDGRAVGVNIARAGRVESYALPVSVVLPLMADLQSGRLMPPPPYAEYEKQLGEALASLKSADETVQKAKADLDRIVGEAQAAIKRVEVARTASEKAVEKARATLEKARTDAKAAAEAIGK